MTKKRTKRKKGYRQKQNGKKPLLVVKAKHFNRF